MLYLLAGQATQVFNLSSPKRLLVKSIHLNNKNSTYDLGSHLGKVKEHTPFFAGSISTEQNKTVHTIPCYRHRRLQLHYHVTFRFILTLEENSGVNVSVDNCVLTQHTTAGHSSPVSIPNNE